ncbi:MAG: hypothetical protein U0470_05855, partial [Anaerolineae bacterium]
ALDAADNDAGRFWSALVAALDAAAPALASEAAALVRARGPLDTDALLAVLIEALAASPVPVILALDHLNAVHEPAVLGALAVLLENLPEAARAILTTRVQPALPTTRWLLDGRLAELTEAELRFSREEARDFFQAQDLPADEDAIARLTDTTEGWIAGLVLAARAARDRGLSAVLASFDGGHRYVGDYLAAEALDTQSEATRSFLIATAVLDRLSGPLCDAVTEREAGTSQSILESLDAENVFVVPLDDARQWFRYHRLYADVLRTRLASERSASDIRVLHRRAARWYRDHDFIARAVGHSLEAGDEAESADLILAAADASWTLGRAATLLSWIRALPTDAIERHPRLGVYTALTLVLMGQSLEIVDPTLDAIAIALADDTPDWRGRMAVVRGIGAGVRGLSDVAAAQSREAMRLLDDDNLPWRGLATIDLGLAELARGDLSAAARAFSEARVLGIRAANPYATLAASVNLARANHADGALHAAAAAYREALACADEHTLHQLPLTGLAHVGLGDVLREWNMCAEAAERIEAGLRLAEGRHVHVRVAVAGHLARARLRFAQGRRAEVESDIDAAEALAMRYDRVEYLADVHYVRALVALQAGDPGPALRWAAADGRRAANGTPSDAVAVSRPRRSRCWRDSPCSKARPTRPSATSRSWPKRWARRAAAWPSASTSSCCGRGWLARGETDRAAAEMRRALALAQPEGYVRAVLDEDRRRRPFSRSWRTRVRRRTRAATSPPATRPTWPRPSARRSGSALRPRPVPTMPGAPQSGPPQRLRPSRRTPRCSSR